jgi:hypothetical protein
MMDFVSDYILEVLGSVSKGLRGLAGAHPPGFEAGLVQARESGGEGWSRGETESALLARLEGAGLSR